MKRGIKEVKNPRIDQMPLSSHPLPHLQEPLGLSVLIMAVIKFYLKLFKSLNQICSLRQPSTTDDSAPLTLTRARSRERARRAAGVGMK